MRAPCVLRRFLLCVEQREHEPLVSPRQRIALGVASAPHACGPDEPHDEVIAILFVLFDVEIIFLYPWAVNFKALGVLGFVEMLVFVTFVLAGLYYVLRKGVMKFE